MVTPFSQGGGRDGRDVTDVDGTELRVSGAPKNFPSATWDVRNLHGEDVTTRRGGRDRARRFLPANARVPVSRLVDAFPRVGE